MNTTEAIKRETVNFSLPVGTIVAWFPRLFHESTPNTVDTTNRISLSDDWAKCDGRDLSLYDGSISDPDYVNNPVHSDSYLINGNFKRVPNISDDRFIMGNFNIGLSPLGGNGNNEVVLTSANLPPHVHAPGTLNVPLSAGVITGNDSPDHTHIYGDGWTTWDNIAPGAFLTGAAGYQGGGATMNVYNVQRTTLTSGITRHQHPVSIPSSAFSGATADGGFPNSAVNILPSYLKAIYIMKVK